MGCMGHEDTVVQGVYGEALDTMLQEARDNAENVALLNVLVRMCDRQQIRDARGGRDLEFSVLYIEDIRTALCFEECLEARRIAEQRGGGAE